jgi:tRNA-specific 2-thiouridylase
MARRISARLDIPFYVVDVQEPFYNHVVQFFIDEYLHGMTPNPCLVCNKIVRWEILLNQALTLEADHLATGHYARVEQRASGEYLLKKSIDTKKDQSYVLHILDQTKLSHALFPIGNMTKSEVREIAQNLGLPVFNRPDSQDLCFLGREDYREFLKRNSKKELVPGSILDVNGNVLGQHDGLAFYTIGQRKGLGVNSPVPLFVIEKNIENNSLVVGEKDQLGEEFLTAKKVHWINGHSPVEPVQAGVKIRYKAPEMPATVTPTSEETVEVKFEDKLRDITPGQAAVFYQADICLGGGIIQ